MNPETGWLSAATFGSLPERFQRAALELQRRGEIVIERIDAGIGQSEKKPHSP